MSTFFQDAPKLGNQYESDRMLRSYLRRVMPAEALEHVEADLLRFGDRVVGDIARMAEDAETHEPVLVQYDPWGRRIDEVRLARGWQELERMSAEEGLVAIGYERKFGSFSRLYQFAKMYLFEPSSAVYSCPLAMTDGAARLIEVHGDDELRGGVYKRLITRDPDRFWTSGQWMTERIGGSDVGRSETIARLEDGEYRLYGAKFFTSAVTAQSAMTLARIVDAQGRSIEGGRGLSVFYLETRDEHDRLNRIRILRLKDKLGTRALPTAELELDGTPAKILGEPGDGVKNIATLFNVTRLYNAAGAVSAMARGLALARDYAARREAFGKPLSDHPLHTETLAELEVEFQAAFHLFFHTITLMGRDECGEATADERAVFRLLTPLVKLYTAKQAVASMSEVVESFGGAGYMEDTGLPKLLRNAQVLSIWEGTTNILSLDALRAIHREGAFEPFLRQMRERVDAVVHPELLDSAIRVREALDRIEEFLPRAAGDGAETVEAGARQFAFSLARTAAGALLLEHAQWSVESEGERRDLVAARRWCARELTPLVWADSEHRGESRALALNEALAELKVSVR